MTTCSMSVSLPPHAEEPEGIMELPLPAAQPSRNVPPNPVAAIAPPSFSRSRRETFLRDNEILSWVRRRRELHYNLKSRFMFRSLEPRGAFAISAERLRTGTRAE